jgi:hypothetical protein
MLWLALPPPGRARLCLKISQRRPVDPQSALGSVALDLEVGEEFLHQSISFRARRRAA